MTKTSLYVRRITISAAFLSIALVLKTAFSIDIPLFGENGMRIGISGIFSMMPAFLFGPAYGAIVSGLTDLIGFLLKPTGPYMPAMTLVLAAGGFIRGGLWLVLKNRKSQRVRIAVGLFSALLLLVGVGNYLFLAADGIDSSFYERTPIEDVNTDGLRLVSRMLITRTINTQDPTKNLKTFTTFITAGVISSALLGILLLVTDFVISKKFRNTVGQVPQLLLTMLIAGLIVTTLNTVLLRETIFPAWKALPFVVVWIPRAVEEILGNTLKVYFVAMLFGVFQRQRGLQEIVSVPVETSSIQ